MLSLNLSILDFWYNFEGGSLKSAKLIILNLKIYLSQMTKIASKLSTMVGENFEIYLSQMTKIAFKL